MKINRNAFNYFSRHEAVKQALITRSGVPGALSSDISTLADVTRPSPAAYIYLCHTGDDLVFRMSFLTEFITLPCWK